MNSINQEVIKAREVVAGYKELNKGTIEQISYYDPKLRLRVFKKVVIDENASKFKKLYGKKENEKKGAAEKLVSKTVSRKPAVKHPAVIVKKVYKAKPKIKKEPKVKLPSRGFSPNSFNTKAYNLHLEGKTNKEIAVLLNATVKRVRGEIYNRKLKLNLCTKRPCTDKEAVIKAYKKGLTIAELMKEFNVGETTVYNIVRADKKPAVKALEKEEVYKAILDKMKLNQSDFIFSRSISPLRHKYKYKMSVIEVIKHCEVLAAENRIIFHTEKCQRNGRKIEIKFE